MIRSEKESTAPTRIYSVLSTGAVYEEAIFLGGSHTCSSLRSTSMVSRFAPTLCSCKSDATTHNTYVGSRHVVFRAVTKVSFILFPSARQRILPRLPQDSLLALTKSGDMVQGRRFAGPLSFRSATAIMRVWRHEKQLDVARPTRLAAVFAAEPPPI